MPSQPRALDAEDRLQAALTAWRTGGLYRSLEACANANAVRQKSLFLPRVVVKQLQDAAKKTSDLPDSLQEDQEDDYISNITDDESSDEEAELIGGGWGQIHQPIEL